MRIAITGGTGFVGRHLARALAASGHEVTLIARGLDDRDRSVMTLPNTSFFSSDLSCVSQLTSTFVACGDGLGHCEQNQFLYVQGLLRNPLGSEFHAYLGHEPSSEAACVKRTFHVLISPDISRAADIGRLNSGGGSPILQLAGRRLDLIESTSEITKSLAESRISQFVL